MNARLYTIQLSHPGHAARLMLEHKGIEHRVTTLPAGMHPVLLRLAGFRGYTVPALRLDGRRVQTSLAIARALEEARTEPALYPGDPELRAAVEEAERWGEAELQPLARRLFRWTLTRDRGTREWLARVTRMPAPALQARVGTPLVRQFAKASGATAERARLDLAELPAKLDRVDALIADGTLSAERPNAAAFQIGTSVRALALFSQLEALMAGRPCDRLARALLPDFPQAPAELPADWLPG